MPGGSRPGVARAHTSRVASRTATGCVTVRSSSVVARATGTSSSSGSSTGWWVPAWRSARASLSGRVADGDRLRHRALELGRRAGDRNVEFVRLIHWVVALADDRLDELDLDWARSRIRT